MNKNKNLTTSQTEDNDPTAESRKRDHIELAFQSQIEEGKLDNRFYYEPLLSAHPEKNSLPVFDFLASLIVLIVPLDILPFGIKATTLSEYSAICLFLLW